MFTKVRKLGKRFFITTNIVVCIVFLLSVFQPFLNPDTFWFIGFLSLAFPYLLMVVLGFIIFWLVFKVKLVFISIITLLIGIKQIGTLFNLSNTKFETVKAADNIRILSWNIKGFEGSPDYNRKQKLVNAERIYQFITEQSPDIICFQEFGNYESPTLKRNYIKGMQNLGYKYYVLSKDYIRGAPFHYTKGNAIFSRHEILSTERFQFTSNPESMLLANIKVNNDTISVYNTHLQSFKFESSDYNDIAAIKNNDKDIVKASGNIFTKMRRAFRNRGQQAMFIKDIIDNSTRPEILCCDLNDVPSSYAYWQLRGNRNDAFLEKGYGIGRTFTGLAPTLRIDYILADKRFEIVQYKTEQKKLSDHYPVIADIKIIKNN